MNKKILKTASIILILNLAALAAWWGFYNEIKKRDKRVVILNQEISLADAKRKNIRNLEQTLQSISREKSEIDDAFVDDASVVRFIEDIEKLSVIADSELEINSASLPARSQDGGPEFGLNLKGSFGRLLKFLAMLEKVNYRLEIESARFGGDGKGSWILQIKLRILSYKFRA